MPATVNMTFENNQNFLAVFNMSQWALLYDLTKAVFRLQIRSRALDPILYAFSSNTGPGVKGSISYLAGPQLLMLSASYDDVRAYMPDGNYVHDLTMEIDDPTTNGLIINRVLGTGTLTISAGVTIR